MGRAGIGGMVRVGEPVHGRAVGARPARDEGGCGPRRGRGEVGVLRWRMAQADGHRARRASAPPRRTDRGRSGSPCGDRDHRQRQAHRRDARAAQIHSAVVSLLRRARGQDRRPRDPDRQAGRIQFHARRAAGRGRGDHAVEFAAAAGDVEARAGARGGQYRGVEAVGILFRFGARVWRTLRARRISAGRGQHRHRLRQRGRRAADHASATSRRLRSPAATAPASSSMASRRKGSSTSRSSWAGNRRILFSTTPISTMP